MGISMLKTSTSAGFNLGKFILKNKYILIILFSLIPVLLTSIQVSREANNPYYIPVTIGLSVINADGILYEQVTILETDPAKIIGMEKPSDGFFQQIKYLLKLARVVWTMIGLVSMITLPFIFFKWLWGKSNDSAKMRSLILALISFIIFILIVNLIMIIVNMSSGSLTYQIDSSLDFFGKAKQVINLIIPFRGVGKLIGFLFMSAI